MPALSKFIALGAALALMSCSPAPQQAPDVVVPDGHVGLRFRVESDAGADVYHWEVKLGSEVVSFQRSVVSAGGGAHVQTLGPGEAAAAATGPLPISSGAEIVFQQELLEGERLLGLLSSLAGAESVEALKVSAPELESASAYLYEWGAFESLGGGAPSVAPGSRSTPADREHGILGGPLPSGSAAGGGFSIHPLDQPIWLACWVELPMGASRSVEVDGGELYIQTSALPSESGEPVVGVSRVPFSEFEGRAWALQVEFASASR